jgi:outer membrane immunogenic protein
LEAQGNWADISGRTANLTDVLGLATVRSKMDAFGLFTGQIGVAWNSVLFYAKGGAAVTDRSYSFFAAGNVLASSTGYETQWSPTAGVGIEYAFAPNWSIGVEYNHIFEGRHDETFTSPAGGSVSGFRAGGDTDMVLGRVNYKFGSAVPLAARY